MPRPQPAAKPRVAFDMTFPNRNGGGSGVYARLLYEALQIRGNVEVVEVAAPDGGGTAGTFRWLLGGARATVRAAEAGLLHCPAFVTPWRSPVPYIITLHDAAALRFPKEFPLEWQLYNRFFLPALARRASAVITGTRTMRAELARFYGIPQRRIAVTTYGVDDRYRLAVAPERIAAMRKLAGAPGAAQGKGALLLCSGAPVARKNLDTVLRVLAAAKKGGDSALSGAMLAISGADAGAFPHYRDSIAAHGLEGRVHWLGRVPLEDMPALYAAANVLVYPSLYEGFGLPPLEAMLVGTPVVASTATCLPEVLGDAAILIAPTDEAALTHALNSVLTDSALCERLSTGGRAHAAPFTWSRCAAQTEEVYRVVIGKEH